MTLFPNYIFIVICALCVAACDTAPGVEDLSDTPPQIHPASSFVAPRALDIVPLTVKDGFVESSLTVSVSFSDADRDVSTLFVVVQSSIAGEDPIGELETNVSGNGEATFQVPLRIPEGAAGVYQVVAFASDTRGAISNQVFGTFEVLAGNEPPVIIQIDIPDTITRPAAGQPAISVPMVVQVSDPDGLQNVQKVEVQVNGAVSLQLCDDGGVGTCNAGFGVSGDVTANDGAFTLTIQLDANNAPGDNFFAFVVEDRAGLRSDVQTRTITVN